MPILQAKAASHVPVVSRSPGPDGAQLEAPSALEPLQGKADNSSQRLALSSLQRAADGAAPTRYLKGLKASENQAADPSPHIHPKTPIQAVMSVADFQAATPKGFGLRHPRNTVANIDVSLGTYIGARTAANAANLRGVIANYVANSTNVGRRAVANQLAARVHQEEQILGQTNNAADIVDGLIDTATAAHFPALLQLATATPNADARTLPLLIQTVGNAHMNDAQLIICVQQAGAGNLGLLPTLISEAGGFGHIASLATVLSRAGNDALDVMPLARVAANGAEFDRLVLDTAAFHIPHNPGTAVVPANVQTEVNAYNAAKNAGYANAVNGFATTMRTAAHTMRINGRGMGAPFNLLRDVFTNVDALTTHEAALTNYMGLVGAGGPEFMEAVIDDIVANVNQLRTRLNGLQGWANGQAVSANRTSLLTEWNNNFSPTYVHFTGVPAPAASGRRDLEAIEFGHYQDRHTFEHFNFGVIKPNNTMWPRAWGAGAAANLEARLVGAIHHLHANNLWLIGGTAQTNIPTGTANENAHIIAYNTANETLRLGMFYPIAYAGRIYDYDGARMRALQQVI